MPVLFFFSQQPEVVEFPNPLLEIPLKEEGGEIIIPGNRALINLNLSSTFFCCKHSQTNNKKMKKQKIS